MYSVAYADGVAHIFVCKSAVVAAHADEREGMRLKVRGYGVGLAEDEEFLDRIVISAIVGGYCYAGGYVALKEHRYLRFCCCKWTYFVEPLSYFPYLWDLTCNEKRGF